MGDEKTEVKLQHNNKFFIYRRGKADNKNLDKVTKNLRRFCGMETKREQDDRSLYSKMKYNLNKILI